MSDGQAIAFWFIIAAIVIFLAGASIGGTYSYEQAKKADREKFLIYCTSKGDSFEACDAIWSGRRVEK